MVVIGATAVMMWHSVKFELRADSASPIRSESINSDRIGLANSLHCECVASVSGRT